MQLLEIHEVNRTCRIDPTSILRVEAQSSYCRIYFINQPGTMLVSKVLAWVQKKLPPGMFVRVHRSHLVNSLHVKSINGSTCQTLELSNGELVSVSRRKNEALRKSRPMFEQLGCHHFVFHQNLVNHTTNTKN